MKKKKKATKSYFPTDEETKAMSWCINRGIRMCPVYHSNTELKMVVEINIEGQNRVMTSPEVFDYYEYSVKAYKGYIYFYNKYKDANIPIVEEEPDLTPPYFTNLFSENTPELWKKIVIIDDLIMDNSKKLNKTEENTIKK